MVCSSISSPSILLLCKFLNSQHLPDETDLHQNSNVNNNNNNVNNNNNSIDVTNSVTNNNNGNNIYMYVTCSNNNNSKDSCPQQQQQQLLQLQLQHRRHLVRLSISLIVFTYVIANEIRMHVIHTWKRSRICKVATFFSRSCDFIHTFLNLCENCRGNC